LAGATLIGAPLPLRYAAAQAPASAALPSPRRVNELRLVMGTSLVFVAGL
jgi:hypothetical protein